MDRIANAALAHGCMGMAAAVRDLIASQWLRDKSLTYQGLIRRHAEDIAHRYGPAKIKAVAARHIDTDLEKFDANPANDRLKVWRARLKSGALCLGNGAGT